MRSRHLEIILYLIRNKKSTVQEMADRFEVSRKTIERDLIRLSSAGIPIRCQQGYNGGVFIDPSYKIGGSTFTPQDIENIVLAMHLLGSVRGNRDGEHVLEKLEMAVPELAYVRKLELASYLHVDLLDRPMSIPGEVFNKINIALEDEVFISLSVRGQTLTVAPLSYVLRPSGLHLHCCDDEKRYLLIPLADVERCSITNSEFIRSDYSEYKAKHACSATEPLASIDEEVASHT